MECNNDFRHVCFKDLLNYIRKDKYFSDFTDEEKKLVKDNLDIVDTTDPEYNPVIITGDHSTIYSLCNENKLKLGYIYIINDFRSIYLDKDNNVCGTDAHIPSKTYSLILHPTNVNSFDKSVQLYEADNQASRATDWIVEYDITPEQFADGTYSKGKILYLKDHNGNYAYYDFKNIKFKKTLEELSKSVLSYTKDTYLYTFDNEGLDNSLLNCKNNHLEKGVTRNVFLGSAKNVTLTADCHDNIFFKNCINCHFDYGTYNNYFLEDASDCKGSVHDKEIKNTITGPKEFITLGDSQFIKYIDGCTLTNQFIEL